MAYDPTLLFAEVKVRLQNAPATSLKALSLSLGVSDRTIQNVVKVKTGKQFTRLRSDILIEEFRSALQSQPNATIKEMCFSMGYKSLRSFTRAISRSTGVSPKALRSRIVVDLAIHT